MSYADMNFVQSQTRRPLARTVPVGGEWGAGVEKVPNLGGLGPC